MEKKVVFRRGAVGKGSEVGGETGSESLLSENLGRRWKIENGKTSDTILRTLPPLR